MDHKSFKDLNKTWYDKLKDDGFEDIEQDEDRLKKWTVTHTNKTLYHGNKETNKYNRDVTLHRMESIQEYYRLVSFFLYDYIFENETHRLIWSMHCDGLSHREISVELRKQGIKISRTPVLNILNNLKSEMKKFYGITKRK